MKIEHHNVSFDSTKSSAFGKTFGSSVKAQKAPNKHIAELFHINISKSNRTS